MRQKIFDFLNKPITFIVVLISLVILTISVDNITYFLGMTIVLFLLWASRWNWLHFGVSKPEWGKTILQAIGWSLVIFFIVDVIGTPILEKYNEPIDLSSFSWLKGNVAGLILFTLLMWVIAGFGEEMLYRGYIMRQMAILLGEKKSSWHVAAILSSILFGLAHLYQGPSGVISTGLVGLMLAYIFLFNPKNLVLPMLVHGFYDMIGITLLFLDKETIVSDWIKTII